MKHLINREDYIKEYLRINRSVNNIIENEIENENELYEGLLGTLFGGLKMLFKILHGDASRISTNITPYHEGYCYVTHDGDFYVDMNNDRVKLNAKDAETLTGMSLEDLQNYIIRLKMIKLMKNLMLM